jgi:hypothetical protein
MRVPHRGFVLALLAAVGVLAAIAWPSHGSHVTGAGALPLRHRVLSGLTPGAHLSRAPAGLLSVPAAARAPISAALGRDQAEYQIRGLAAHNPSQGLAARFGRSGVAITAGRTRFGIALTAFGRGGTLRPLAAVPPVASSDRVTYARGPVREWWVNGPLGLEQGFNIARRASGSGALTLSLAVSGRVRLENGAVLLPGGLRYAGLRATDAQGHSLRAWFQVRDGRILVRVADRGAVYPIRIDPTVEQAELTPSDGVGCDGNCGDEFGYSVATSGNTVVVGAPYHEANSEAYSGAVYVFQMPAAGWASATQTAELSDSTLGGNAELGFSVAISSDGDTIVAGAPAGSEAPPQEHVNPCPTSPCSQGTVDVFTATGAWASTSTPNARLTVAGTESPLGGELGWSVAIDGSTIVAGAPYDPTYPSFGEAYVFVMPAGGWVSENQTAELSDGNPSNPDGGEDFGWSVGISGTTIVVGAYGQGPSSGYSAPGAAYVFVMPPGGWVNATQNAELTSSDDGGYDDLGWSVAVSGNTVVAGAWNHTVGANTTQGAVYVFVMPASGWANSTQTAELTASDGQGGDELGYSVAISDDTILAGAPGSDIAGYVDAGAAYVYTQPAGGWATTSAFAAELTAADANTDDHLGDSVAVSGTTFVAGAPGHNSSSPTTEIGAADVLGPGSVVVPPPVVPPPVVVAPPAHPTVKLGSIAGGHGKITVALSCPAGGATCARVSLNARVTEHLKGRKIRTITAITAAHPHQRVRTTTKQVVIASGGVTLSAGTKKTLTLRLDSTGRALLSKFGKLKTIVTVTSGGRAVKTVSVKVLRPAKKTKKK